MILEGQMRIGDKDACSALTINTDETCKSKGFDKC